MRKVSSTCQTRSLAQWLRARFLRSWSVLSLNNWRNIVSIDKFWRQMSRSEWMGGDLIQVSQKLILCQTGRKFVYKSIDVELCLSRESAPLAPLPSVAFLQTQKSTSTSTSTKLSSPFSKRTISVCLGKTPILPCCTTTAFDHTAAATVQWLENFGKNFIPERDWPADPPEFSPKDYSVNRISSADFGSERHPAWRDWHRPCARSGQKCLLISVLKRFLPGNPVWNLCFWVMTFTWNTWSHFFLFHRVKKTE